MVLGKWISTENTETRSLPLKSKWFGDFSVRTETSKGTEESVGKLTEARAVVFSKGFLELRKQDQKLTSGTEQNQTFSCKSKKKNRQSQEPTG